MERFNDKVVLTGEEIIGNVCTAANYRNLTQRGSLKVVRRGCRNTPALIDYETMPEKYKQIVIKLYGDPVKVLSTNQLSNLVEHDQNARDFFNSYITVKDKYLPAERINEYIANAELLNAIGSLLKSKSAFRKLLGGTKGNIWQNIAKTLSELDRVKFPHSLPENPVRLRDKFNSYKLGGYVSLIHSGYGNNNSEKLTELAKSWLLARWANVVDRATSIEHLFSLYNAESVNQGWNPIESSQTIRNFIYSEGVKDLWWGYRYGELNAKEKFSMQHSTRLPSMRDSLWYSDGTKVNYFYLTEDGKIDTISVYEVMDAYSEVLLGYHISKSEDYEAQYKAYKMAAQFAGHRPYELGFDNQGGHKKLITAEFFDRLAHLSIKKMPYNGKSKTIENAFYRFQAQFLKQDWFFTGQNIQSKKQESKANMEFILANQKSLPSLSDLHAIYRQRHQDWNNAPHFSTGLPKIEMYRNSHNPKSEAIGLMDMVDLFWMLRPDPVTLNAYGISFKEKGVKFDYLVYKDGMPDQLWLRKNIDKKFWIKFDPEDTSLIYLYEKDTTGLRFATAAETKITVARGKQEQESFETSYITKVNNENKAIRSSRMNEMDSVLAQFNMRPEDYGLRTPGIKGVTKKNTRTKADIGTFTKKLSNVVTSVDGDVDYRSLL